MGESTKIRIGPWTATPELNLLVRGAQSIKIEPRAMDVLVVLAQAGGAVVSVEQLIASAWKGAVVGDGSVYLAIRQLRQVLDEPPNGTRYIETIPKRGYRLTVPSALASIATRGDEALPRPQNTQPFRRWLMTAVAAVVFVAGITFALRDAGPPRTDSFVAVLPFENLSSDPEQEYFADGVTAEILNTLSEVRGLRVIGGLSAFDSKGRSEHRGAVGVTLGVEHLLEGSVRKSGDQLRIGARLSNARTGEQLWSESYERRLDDIFLIQDEIARAVASALQVKLGVGAIGHVPGMTRDVAAYDEYLRGVAYAREWRPESFPLGIAHLQRAVALDPSFSIAWNGLGMTYMNGAGVVPTRADEWGPLGNDALERARSLTPDAPHVLLSTAIVETRHGDWLEAASIFKRLEGSLLRYGMAHQAWGPRGAFLVFVGRVREAIPVLERARAEDPLAPGVASTLSLAYMVDGDFPGALAENERGLKLEDPDLKFLRERLLIGFNGRDHFVIDKLVGDLPGLSPKLARLVDVPAEAAAEIRDLASTASPSVKTGLAYWAAYFQEPELSLELWTEGARNPDGLWQPLMRSVRILPAFKEIVRELGLVDYWRAYGWPDFCRPIDDEDFVCN